jgi:hypothetical protein
MYSCSCDVPQTSKVHNARHRRVSPCRVHAATGTYTHRFGFFDNSFGPVDDERALNFEQDQAHARLAHWTAYCGMILYLVSEVLV